MTVVSDSAWSQYASSTLLLAVLAATALFVAGCADADNADEGSSADAGPASDLSALDSEHVETPFETAYAHVHRVELPAGAALSPHEGGARVIYSLQPYTLQFKTEGTTSERTFDADDVHYHSGGVHEVENTGDQAASFLAFERVDGSLPSASPSGKTLEEVSIPDGSTHEVVFDNDRMAVHRVALAPGEALPSHYGAARIVYSLTEYTLTFVDAEDDNKTERSFSEGELHDHEPGEHRVENTGDRRAEYLAVIFRK